MYIERKPTVQLASVHGAHSAQIHVYCLLLHVCNQGNHSIVQNNEVQLKNVRGNVSLPN